MLPPGLAADLLPPGDAARLLGLHDEARTAVRILSGACSCDLFVQRDRERHREESELRRRYRGLGLSRDAQIRALDRHRRSPGSRKSPARWGEELAAFVAEHARNAGPTLYYREVSGGGLRGPGGDAQQLTVAQVRAAPGEWLVEDRPTLVVR
jgi:hypothetical protein